MCQVYRQLYIPAGRGIFFFFILTFPPPSPPFVKGRGIRGNSPDRGYYILQVVQFSCLRRPKAAQTSVKTFSGSDFYYTFARNMRAWSGVVAKVKLFCVMKKALLAMIMLCAVAGEAAAQNRHDKGYTSIERVNDNGEELTMIRVAPVPIFNRRRDMRRYQRLVDAVKRVYPIAVTARERMAGMEDTLLMLKTKREQQIYIKRVERDITREYTPILRKMTRSQGRILIKLISRETDQSAFEIVREFRGRVEAGAWQLVAKIFGHNLKTEYDPEGEDAMIEQIVKYIEAGLL